MAYRAPDEVATLRATTDPLQRFRAALAARPEGAALGAAQLDAIERDCVARVDAAVTAARAAPFPAPETLERDVYVSL
jgi:pyruvate dehydrogenase E1 component alpha subunit